MNSKAAKGEQEQGSRGDQQGHRAVVAFHPKGFRCACGKKKCTTSTMRYNLQLFGYVCALLELVIANLAHIVVAV